VFIVIRLIHSWASKNECLTKEKIILDFHNVQYIANMVIYCVPTIRVLRLLFKNSIIIKWCIIVLMKP